jgi:outer membrane protein OmpA-like peptidoglycan-associated protein
MNEVRAWTVGLALVLAVVTGGCSTVQTVHDHLVQSPPRCEDQSAEIYFDPDSAELTNESRAVIRAAANAARGCIVDRVEVLGLADAVGAPEVNLELSKRRAQSVTAALALSGLPAAEFRVAAAGAKDAIAPTGETKPLRRRADVVLRLRPEPADTAAKTGS